MPNIKSAKKRVKVTSTKHESNIPVKGSMKTAVKKVEKEFDTAKDKWTIANVYGFKENYIYVSISGKEDGKESTKFVRLKNDLSATDVLESESLVPTDLINNINLEK